MISPTHFWHGAEAVKSCFKRLGATGRECLEFVVALNFVVRSGGFHTLLLESISYCLAGHMSNSYSVADHRKPLMFGLTAVKSAVEITGLVKRSPHGNMGRRMFS